MTSAIYPETYGAVGDGASHPLSSAYGTLAAAQAVYPHATALTDEIDWCAIQSALNALGTTGGVCVISKKYLINRGLKFTQANIFGANPTSPEENFLLPAGLGGSIISFGNGQIKATASMTSMLTISFTSGNIEPAPQNCLVEGLVLDCNNLADCGIYSNWAFGTIIRKNTISRPLQMGVDVIGYAAKAIEHNTIILAPTCIRFSSVSGSRFGGDCTVSCNWLYPTQFGVEFQDGTGNVIVCNNIFNHDDNGSVGGPVEGTYLYAVKIDGSNDNTCYSRDIRILNNEVYGYQNAVLAIGYSSAFKNIYNLEIAGNHIHPATLASYSNELVNTGGIAEIRNATGIVICNNRCNSRQMYGTTNYGILLYDVDGYVITGNSFQNYESSLIYANTVTGGVISSNAFYDCGTANSGNVVIELDGASIGNAINANMGYQSSTSYGQYFLKENGTSDYNNGVGNNLYQLATKHLKVGSAGTNSTVN